MEKKKEIAKYGKLIHEKELVIGSGGNISVKDNGKLIIKKKCADMSKGDINDYLSIFFKDAGKENDSLSSETPMHLETYKAREDIQAIIHVHSPVMIAAAAKIDLLESPSYEFDCLIKKAVPVVDYLQPGSQQLAQAVADKFKAGANAVLMRRHGGVSIGKDLEEAYFRILALERACKTFLFSL